MLVIYNKHIFVSKVTCLLLLSVYQLMSAVLTFLAENKRLQFDSNFSIRFFCNELQWSIYNIFIFRWFAHMLSALLQLISIYTYFSLFYLFCFKDKPNSYLLPHLPSTQAKPHSIVLFVFKQLFKEQRKSTYCITVVKKGKEQISNSKKVL